MEKSEPFEIPNRGGVDKTLDSRVLLQPHYRIPKIFLVVNLLNLRSECLVSYDPHFPGNDGTKKFFAWAAEMRYEVHGTQKNEL